MHRPVSLPRSRRLAAAALACALLGWAGCRSDEADDDDADAEVTADVAGIPPHGGTGSGDDHTCASPCPGRANASPSCTSGVCGYLCKADFLDCNGVAADGCEISTKADPAHCGSCENACGGVEHGAPVCRNSLCRAACDGAWMSCHNNPGVCDTDTDSDPAHCGSCDNACSGRVHAAPHCSAGTCDFHCSPGFADCNQNEEDGCEVDIFNDAQHCGSCFGFCTETKCFQGSCTCAASTQTATVLPLDLYIMMDQSGSMTSGTGTGLSKWAAISQAIKGFVNDGAAAGIGVGLQFFPLQTCAAAEYAKPEVPILPLPGNAESLLKAIAKHQPNGSTPTAAALEGAITYAGQFVKQNPTHTVAVVLATDGIPTSCAPLDTVPAVAGIAAAGWTNAKVQTFVIGVGSELAALNAISAAGGTKAAFLVDVAGNVVQQFAAALKAIQGLALACSYAIPTPLPGEKIDFEKVNVQMTLGTGPPQLLTYVGSEAACAPPTLGWHYDDPVTPTKIQLCAATCAVPASAGSVKVELILGCARF